MNRRLVGLVVAVVAVGLGCAPLEDAQPGQVTVPSVAVPASTIPTRSDPPEVGPPTSQRASCESYADRVELPLRRCDGGELVSRVQGELANTLGLDLAVDGLFGDLTEAAVIRYQSEQGLAADGLVGPATWNQLFGSSLTTDGATRGIGDNWFGRPADKAVDLLQAQGFLVTDYEVCSSSVAAGEVRQIIGGDGTVYVDEAGVTAVGSQLPIGSVIEVQIGSGQSC